MYNGIGLLTTRGTGTSGYVQQNRAAVRRNRRQRPPVKRGRREQNAAILDHEKRRKVEVAVAELEEDLAERGYEKERIMEMADRLRQDLLSRDKEENEGELQREVQQLKGGNRRGEVRRLTAGDLGKVREAFGISHDFKPGDSLRRMRRREDAQHEGDKDASGDEGKDHVELQKERRLIGNEETGSAQKDVKPSQKWDDDRVRSILSASSSSLSPSSNEESSDDEFYRQRSNNNQRDASKELSESNDYRRLDEGPGGNDGAEEGLRSLDRKTAHESEESGSARNRGAVSYSSGHSNSASAAHNHRARPGRNEESEDANRSMEEGRHGDSVDHEDRGSAKPHRKVSGEGRESRGVEDSESRRRDIDRRRNSSMSNSNDEEQCPSDDRGRERSRKTRSPSSSQSPNKESHIKDQRADLNEDAHLKNGSLGSESSRGRTGQSCHQECEGDRLVHPSPHSSDDRCNLTKRKDPSNEGGENPNVKQPSGGKSPKVSKIWREQSDPKDIEEAQKAYFSKTPSGGDKRAQSEDDEERNQYQDKITPRRRKARLQKLYQIAKRSLAVSTTDSRQIRPESESKESARDNEASERDQDENLSRRLNEGSENRESPRENRRRRRGRPVDGNSHARTRTRSVSAEGLPHSREARRSSSASARSSPFSTRKERTSPVHGRRKREDFSPPHQRYSINEQYRRGDYPRDRRHRSESMDMNESSDDERYERDYRTSKRSTARSSHEAHLSIRDRHYFRSPERGRSFTPSDGYHHGERRRYRHHRGTERHRFRTGHGRSRSFSPGTRHAPRSPHRGMGPRERRAYMESREFAHRRESTMRYGPRDFSPDEKRRERRANYDERRQRSKPEDFISSHRRGMSLEYRETEERVRRRSRSVSPQSSHYGDRDRTGRSRQTLRSRSPRSFRNRRYSASPQRRYESVRGGARPRPYPDDEYYDLRDRNQRMPMPGPRRCNSDSEHKDRDMERRGRPYGHCGQRRSISPGRRSYSSESDERYRRRYHRERHRRDRRNYDRPSRRGRHREKRYASESEYDNSDASRSISPEQRERRRRYSSPRRHGKKRNWGSELENEREEPYVQGRQKRARPLH